MATHGAAALHVLQQALDGARSGESCSFSQSDLLAHVQAWIDKAGERLRA